jgi:hypothetical protein
VVGAALALLSFVIDHRVGDRLLVFLLRSQDETRSSVIVRTANSTALLVTFYANVTILMTNCFLAFFIFPICYGPWVRIIGYVMLMSLILETGWLSQYEAEAYASVSDSAISGGTASEYGLEQISNMSRFGRLP